MRFRPDDSEADDLTLGEPDTEEEAQAASEPEEDVEDEDDEPPEPPAQTAPPPAPHVPFDRFEQIRAENDQLRQILLSVQQQQAPPPVHRPAAPSYVRPEQPDDWKPWAGRIGETVQPVIEAVRQELRQEIQQGSAANAFVQSENRARGLFRDYSQYEADINVLVRGWLPTLTQIPPALHEIAYRTVKSVRGDQQGNGQQASTARRRAATAGRPENARPARAAKKGGDGPLTAERIARMTPEEIKKAAEGLRF